MVVRTHAVAKKNRVLNAFAKCAFDFIELGALTPSRNTNVHVSIPAQIRDKITHESDPK